MRKNVKLYKFLSGLHIYGGLFCALFLFIAGISVLNFQHHLFNIKETYTRSFAKDIRFDPAQEDMALATAIRDSLGIIGHVPPWDFRSDSAGLFAFKVYRPSRRFDITLNRNETRVKINEVFFGAGMALDMLHKSVFGELDDAMLKTWSWYGQVAALMALLSILTSVYFWIKKSIRHRRGWVIVLTVGTSALAFIVFLWQIG